MQVIEEIAKQKDDSTHKLVIYFHLLRQLFLPMWSFRAELRATNWIMTMTFWGHYWINDNYNNY
jgi:hypothetical protein